MIGVEQVILECRGLSRAELEHWIANAWIRPEGTPGQYRFHEIDLARIRLIIELRETLEVNEAALPTVLSLLDQLYEMRRRMQRLNQAMGTHIPPDLMARLFEAMD